MYTRTVVEVEGSSKQLFKSFDNDKLVAKKMAKQNTFISQLLSFMATVKRQLSQGLCKKEMDKNRF